MKNQKWLVEKYGENMFKIESQNEPIAIVNSFNFQASEIANLIAAAPEMLAALKSVVNYLDGLKGPFNHELLNLKDVIRKAEGAK